MRDEEGRKQGHTNNKAKQHSTPKAVTFPKKNEIPRVGLKPTTLLIRDAGGKKEASKVIQTTHVQYSPISSFIVVTSHM